MGLLQNCMFHLTKTHLKNKLYLSIAKLLFRRLFFQRLNKCCMCFIVSIFLQCLIVFMRIY